MPQQTSAARHLLAPHPSSLMGAVTVIAVLVDRTSPEVLRLTYQLKGDLGALRLPEPRPPVRADGLWRHTCFEAFVGRPDGPEYWEYNFSPSGAWAAYHFTGFREGMAPHIKGAAPVMTLGVTADMLSLEVTLDLGWYVKSSASPALRLGLSAVVEDKARVLSYWALKHPAEKPDFHHPDGRAILLD